MGERAWETLLFDEMSQNSDGSIIPHLNGFEKREVAKGSGCNPQAQGQDVPMFLFFRLLYFFGYPPAYPFPKEGF